MFDLILGTIDFAANLVIITAVADAIVTHLRGEGFILPVLDAVRGRLGL
ncbi:MAG: hypothetical protein R3D03_10265 [Geminicoccaceae bacterium]